MDSSGYTTRKLLTMRKIFYKRIWAFVHHLSRNITLSRRLVGNDNWGFWHFLVCRTVWTTSGWYLFIYPWCNKPGLQLNWFWPSRTPPSELSFYERCSSDVSQQIASFTVNIYSCLVCKIWACELSPFICFFLGGVSISLLLTCMCIDYLLL